MLPPQAVCPGGGRVVRRSPAVWHTMLKNKSLPACAGAVPGAPPADGLFSRDGGPERRRRAAQCRRSALLQGTVTQARAGPSPSVSIPRGKARWGRAGGPFPPCQPRIAHCAMQGGCGVALPAHRDDAPSPDGRVPSAGPPCVHRSAAATSAGASATGPGRGTGRPRAWCTG